MKYGFLLLFTLVGMLVVMVVAGLQEGATAGPGQHGEFKTMLVGGDRARYDVQITALGYLFGAFILTFIFGLVLLGLENGRPDRTLRSLFSIGFVLYLAAFSMMFWRYRATIETEELLTGLFPSATSWLIFGVWGAPVFFVIVFVVGYRNWFQCESDN